MMATTADYLNKLVDQKNALADNLVTKGVTATHNETLETLVPKVLEISGGGGGSGEGIYPIGEDGRPTGDVIVPEGVTSLSSFIFKSNKNVTSVTLPESLTELEGYCFQECSLQTVIIPNNVAAIPSGCFDASTQLNTITLGDKLQNISPYAFRNCQKLKNIIFPSDSTLSYTLGNNAFERSAVDDICAKNIISHAKTIGNYIFSYCTSLTNVEVPVFAEFMFYQCTNLITAKNTQASEKIGNSVFYGCRSLTEVFIADGLTTIGYSIFSGCTSLKKVYLPSSITTAINNSLTATTSSYYIFYNCTVLEDVQLGQDWSMSLRLDVSNNLTVDSMVAMFNSLKDLTGDTAKILTLGATNLAKLTDEYKAIATNKNWTLA